MRFCLGQSFFSPLDHRIFILPELFHSKRNVGDLGGVYSYWHKKDMTSRATSLAHRAFYQRDGPATIFDQTRRLQKMNPIEPDMHLCQFVT